MNLSRDDISRRAFSPESRTVWVESQIVGSSVVPRDNFPLGPGDYLGSSPNQISSRHVPSPTLGCKSTISPFLSFRSNVIRSPTEIPFSRLDSPNRRRKEWNPTPHGWIHEPILGPFTSTVGISKSPNVAFSKALLDRNPTRPSLPDYEIQDEKLRRKPKLATLPKERRFRYPKTEAELDREYEDKLLAFKQQLDGEPSQFSWKSSLSSLKKFDSASRLDANSMIEKVSLASILDDETVKTNSNKTKLKQKSKFKILLTNEAKVRRTFDDSSYKKFKKPMPLDLNPIIISRLSRCHVFDSSFAKASLYKSNRVGSSVAESVKMHSTSSY